MDKTCKRCGETKPLTEFYVIRCKGKRPHPHPHCKGCHKAQCAKRSAKYRADSPEKFKNDAREREARWRKSHPEYRAISIAKHKEWKKTNPEKVAKHYRARKLKHAYGISIDEFERMLLLQDGKCAICGSPNPKWKGPWHIDHCHQTGVVRGVLCKPCNTGLGYFDDDIATLRAAIIYLKNQPACTNVTVVVPVELPAVTLSLTADTPKA